MVALQTVPEGWIGVVEQARILKMHPESLRRKMRYGELPNGSYQMFGRSLFFNPEKISGGAAMDNDAS